MAALSGPGLFSGHALEDSESNETHGIVQKKAVLLS